MLVLRESLEASGGQDACPDQALRCFFFFSGRSKLWESWLARFICTGNIFHPTEVAQKLVKASLSCLYPRGRLFSKHTLDLHPRISKNEAGSNQIINNSNFCETMLTKQCLFLFLCRRMCPHRKRTLLFSVYQ